MTTQPRQRPRRRHDNHHARTTTTPTLTKAGGHPIDWGHHTRGPKPDLVLTAQDVHLSSMNPRVGDALTAVINVRNASAIDVTGAKVIWTLMVDGKQTGQGEFAISVKANSSAQVQWKGTVPNAQR